MLVLTRKLGEEIIIGGDIVVTVVEATNGRVKLGIVAPKSVRVDRSEVRDQREKTDEPLAPAALHNRLPEESKYVPAGQPVRRVPFKRRSR